MIKKVGVLVLNFNGKHHLKECFDSLYNQSYKDFEVILVDNNSSDGSVDYVKSCYPWVKVITFPENYGFAGAYNRAVSMCKYEYIVFLNNDTVVTRDWLVELMRNVDLGIGDIFGSKLLFYDNRNLINHAGGKLTIVGAGFDVGSREQDNYFKDNSKAYCYWICLRCFYVDEKGIIS